MLTLLDLAKSSCLWYKLSFLFCQLINKCLLSFCHKSVMWQWQACSDSYGILIHIFHRIRIWLNSNSMITLFLSLLSQKSYRNFLGRLKGRVSCFLRFLLCGWSCQHIKHRDLNPKESSGNWVKENSKLSI